MTIQALHAIRAAKNRYNWGLLPTLQYLAKRQVPFKLYRVARQLEAVKDLENHEIVINSFYNGV